MAGRCANRRRHRNIVGACIAALVIAGSVVAQTRPAGAAVPTISVVSSMQQVRPTQTLSPTPGSVSLTSARNEVESFQIVVQGPATNVSLSGDLFGWGTTGRYRMAYNDVVEPSDGEGAVGRWGDALIPEVDQLYSQNRNAFPFDVPSGENRVIWVDVFVPTTVGSGVFADSLTLSANGTSTQVAVTLEVLNLTIPATSSLRSAFYLNYQSGSDDSICRAHTGTNNCGGDATLRRTLYSMYSRLALDNRTTLANGSGLRADQNPANYPAAEWENLIEGPTIRGTGPCRPVPSGVWGMPRPPRCRNTPTGIGTVAPRAPTPGRQRPPRPDRTSRTSLFGTDAMSRTTRPRSGPRALRLRTRPRPLGIAPRW